MIPDEEIERIREAADIVGIIGEYVELRRTGTDFRGACPFHQGTHRNFSVSPKKRMYYCFVCHEAGDAFSFLQKRLGVEWPVAVKMVAEKSGLEVREVKRQTEGPDPRSPLWEANAAAAAFFQRTLWSDDSARPAREYLAKRQIPRDAAERFGLGFAPKEPGAMRAHLNTLGISDATQLEAGLLVRDEGGREPRPRFRQRLMFPILDISSRNIGFGGRVIGQGEPKYLNSPESPVFAKGQQLYNLQLAKLAMRKDDRAFLVEGYFDVLRLVMAGIDGVVAPMGTALTEEQSQLIVRHTKNVYLLYDSDKAGLKATFRSGDALLAHGASVRVVSLPAGEDPDTFAQKYGAAGLEREVSKSVDIFERKVQILERGGWFRDLQRRRQAIDHLLPTVRATVDPVMRELYMGRAAEISGVDKAVLARELAAPRRPGSARAREEKKEAEPEVAAPTPEKRKVVQVRRGKGVSAEQALVLTMLHVRPMVERIAERIGPESFHEALYQEIFQALLEEGSEAPIEQLAARLSDGAVEVMQKLLDEQGAIQNLERTVEDSLGRLEERRLEERNREIDTLIRVASSAEQDVLLQEKVVNQKELARLRELRETR